MSRKKKLKTQPSRRSMPAYGQAVRTGSAAGRHKNSSYDFRKGRTRKRKHRKRLHLSHH